MENLGAVKKGGGGPPWDSTKNKPFSLAAQRKGIGAVTSQVPGVLTEHLNQE